VIKVIKNSKNEVPRDKNGVLLKAGQVAVAEIIRDQPEMLVDGKTRSH